MIQKIRHHDEDRDGAARSDLMVGDRGGQMRLAATVGAGEHQPPFGVFGEGPRP